MLDGIYAAYTIGSNVAAQGSDAALPPALSELTAEAVYLARLVVQLQGAGPDAGVARAEALGLLSLLLYCKARRPAQFDAAGRFVPLAEQDTGLWHTATLREAEACLLEAARLRRPGSFQTEAAIQSAHCQRAATGQTPWAAIARLYGALVHQHPSIGAQVGRAVALAESGALVEGLGALRALDGPLVVSHQPYWVALAHLLRRSGHPEEADAARQRAISLTADARVREHLQGTRGPASAGPRLEADRSA